MQSKRRVIGLVYVYFRWWIQRVDATFLPLTRWLVCCIDPLNPPPDADGGAEAIIQCHK